MIMHEHRTESNRPSIGSERTFGMVFSVFFSVVAAWSFFQGQQILAIAMLVAAATATFMALVIPKLLKIPNLLWFKFGLLLHKIVSPLVLGALFFLTLSPIGLLMRLLGKDPLVLKIDKSAQSYWIYRHPPGPEPSSMKRQF